MLQGKTQGALRYLSRSTSGGVLQLDDLVPETTSDGESETRSVQDILKDKHPVGKDPSPGTLLNGDPEPVNPILFDGLDADTIRQAALQTQGAAGPSGSKTHDIRD